MGLETVMKMACMQGQLEKGKKVKQGAELQSTVGGSCNEKRAKGVMDPEG